jgi:hypothetical protein
LESDWESLSAQGETIDRQLKELLQQRGAQVEQQRAAAADQSLAKKQLELDVVDAQIVEKVEAWRERAAIGVLLEEIRDEYEKFRQPETLREASVYMAKLTSGKYKRIWTPLANDILLVDTEEGDSLPVDVLSRGTREQLFVSLRLALVAAFGRRGIKLPMILDDVFVNFDAGRTKIAVSVLREFAREGHQLMVFTCHEHVWRLFADVQADTRRIPDRFNDNQEIQIEEVVAPESEPQLPEPVVELPAPEPEPEPEPEVVASEPALVEEVVEEFVTEFEPEPEPVARELDEVEYWWHDSAVNGSTNGAAMARKIKKASTNGHHGTAVETEVETWPVEPMIHRPDWW